MSLRIFRASACTTAVLVFSAMLAASPALAVTFTVNSIDDLPDTNPGSGTCHTTANTCTLRAAVMQANRSSGVGATIVLPPGVYSLKIPASASFGDDTNGDLNLAAPPSGSPLATISITGAGAATTIIDGNQLDRVFHVHPGRTATISGVTIRNGFGAGILNEGQLTVSDAVISLNTLGGISNLATLAMINSTITQNTGGGGIFNGGAAVVTNSTISHNAAPDGGGIFNGSNLTVRNSTISDNGAVNGGGIRNQNNLVVINSTITQNHATNDGGGIHNGFASAIANVYNATIVFNGADSDRDGGSGGGVFNVAGATFNLRNSIVAGNDVGNTPIYDECTGTLNLYGSDFFGVDAFGAAACTLNQTIGSSLGALNSFSFLGPLQDNGGPTPTVALLPGSSAIDHGDSFFGCTDNNGVTLATDQRGQPRAVGARCDVGAFEYGVQLPPSTSFEGLWWHAPAQSESGWGINFAHQGDAIFATWFTYDVTGKAWWLTMTANLDGPGIYNGLLIRTNGAPLGAYVPPATATVVGTGTLIFTGPTTGTFNYTVNDGANVASQSKAIVLQTFGPVPTCVWGAQPDLTKATNYQDLWWAAGGTESGWGVNLIHQGSTIFATWFTYDTNRNPVWYSATATQSGPKTFTGTLLRTNGPAFNAVPFNPDLVGRTTVGTATLTFTSGNDGTFTYQVNDGANVANQTKAISRQVFRAPGTVCG